MGATELKYSHELGYFGLRCLLDAQLPVVTLSEQCGVLAPNPIQESGVRQPFSLFDMIPIRTRSLFFGGEGKTLNPSRLQFLCKEEPAISDFHLLRPMENKRR